MKATLWAVEYCGNNIGIWNFSWYATEEEANARVKGLKDEGYSTDIDDGSWGSLLKPYSVDVDLTPEGLLNFANEFAIDRGA